MLTGVDKKTIHLLPCTIPCTFNQTIHLHAMHLSTTFPRLFFWNDTTMDLPFTYICHAHPTGQHIYAIFHITTSVMIYHRRANLSEQHADLLIGHRTKQDLSRTSNHISQQSGQLLSVWLHMHELSFTL